MSAGDASIWRRASCSIQMSHICPVDNARPPLTGPTAAQHCGQWICHGWIYSLELAMSERFKRRLVIVRERIEELEQITCGDRAIVYVSEARHELRELYAEVEYLEALAA